MIKIYNTLTKKVENLGTIKNNEIKLYSCGPTVYNFVHIGNLRAYIFVDLLKRFLKYSGFSVTHVMNITDVDDKTIKGSIESNKTLGDFTSFYLEAFLKDLNSLNIQLPDIMPKATNHIKEMVFLIEELINKGYAYKVDGSVYFRINKDKNYGQLAQLEKQELKKNTCGRLDHDEYKKDSVNDFVLWKARTQKDGDVYWDTEIGVGRPGWHIECSAMAMKYLGETIDIHTGGVDLIFPHHTNEIAQSENVTGKKFVNHWMHNGHLLVEGNKMSKSLGNFYTLQDIIDKGYDPLLLKLILLKVNYRQTINFRFDDFKEADKILFKFLNLLVNIDFAVRKQKTRSNNLYDLSTLINEYRVKFKDALSEDLNISLALSCIFSFIREVNKSLSLFDVAELKMIKEFIFEIDQVLGFIQKSYDKYRVELDKKIDATNVISLLEERELARELNDYKKADKLRDKILSFGLLIEDTGDSYLLKIEKI